MWADVIHSKLFKLQHILRRAMALVYKRLACGCEITRSSSAVPHSAALSNFHSHPAHRSHPGMAATPACHDLRICVLMGMFFYV